MNEEGEPVQKRPRVVDLSVDQDENLPTDVELILQNIAVYTASFHGFVFLHQIYATLENKTIVDDQIALLRESGRKYKFMNFGRFTTTQQSCTVIIGTDRYLSHLRTELANNECSSFVEAELLDKFSSFIQRNNQMSFAVKDMQSAVSCGSSSSSSKGSSSFNASELNWLVLKGFLRPQSMTQSSSTQLCDDEVYWLWHCALGQLSMYIDNAEKQIIAWISRTKYKEISERELTRQDDANELRAAKTKQQPQERSFIKARPVKGVKYVLSSDAKGQVVSVLPMAYHLLDLLGRKKISKSRNNATNDCIIRLPK